jgi:hypothetical protein
MDDTMRHFAHLQDLQALVGQEIGLSEWITVDQQRIDQFAQATGDHQWIHVDPVRAAEGPFGKTIAHGFLTLSLMPEMFASAFTVDGALHCAGAQRQPRARTLRAARLACHRRRCADVGDRDGRAGRLGQAGLRGRSTVAPLCLNPPDAAARCTTIGSVWASLENDDEGAAGR